MADYQLGNLVWKITGDSSGIDKSLDKSEKKVGKTKSAFSKAAKVVGGALLAVGIGKFAKSLIKAASDAEETANKFGVVFSKMSKEANAAARGLAAGYGLSRTASKELLSDTGDLLTGFGLTQKEALKLSETSAKLGADLASFTNYAGGAKGATQALTKAMLGEREQAKMLGIAITETELIKFAEDQGKAWKEMSRGEKASTTLALAMTQSKNAIGDFARSSNSFANQMRIAEANTQDFKESLGNVLLPIATLGVKTFNEMGNSLSDSADELSEFIRSAEGASIVGEVIGSIAGGFAVLKTMMGPVISALGDALDNIIEPFSELGDEGLNSTIILQGLSKVFLILSSGVQIVGRLLGGVIQVIIDLGKVAYNTGQLLSSFWDAIKGKGFTGVKENFNEIIEISKKLGENVGDTFLDIADIVVDTVNTIDSETSKLSKDAEKNFITSFSNVKKSVVDAFTAIQDVSSNTAASAEESGAKFREVWEQTAATMEKVNVAVSMTGESILNLLSSISSYQDAVFEKRLAQIDEQMQRELEAAGVAEETAIERAESEIAAAQESGDEQALIEAQKELKRAQILEKYEKKKAKLEYKAAVRSWEYERAEAGIQLVMAPLQAFVSGLSAPWPLTIPMAVAQAAVAQASTAIQYAAVVAAKPQAPKFAEGGIVPGTSSGTLITAGENNQTELVSNPEQMANLLNAIGNGAGGGMRRVKAMDADVTWNELYQASKNGNLYIHEDAITNK